MIAENEVDASELLAKLNDITLRNRKGIIISLHPLTVSMGFFNLNFINNREIHNAVKTIIDLRVAKYVDRTKELKPYIEEILSKSEYAEEYERGRESWRFALLKRKYPTLRDLIATWFK